MAFLCLLLLAGLVSCSAVPLDTRDSAPAVHPNMVSEINALNTWKAGASARFSKLSMGVVKSWMGVDVDSHVASLPPASREQLPATVPPTFDARAQWPDCVTITLIRDQSECASSWAVATAASQSDRMCVQSKGAVKVSLSAEQLISCCSDCGLGCHGGYPIAAWDYFKAEGLVSEGFYPSTMEPCDKDGLTCGHAHITPKCNSENLDAKRYHGKSAYAVGGFAERDRKIQEEIFNNGPVVAVMRVYTDFLVYRSGVYTHATGSLLGGHAVRIIGWGTERDTPYWLVANSFGTLWGEAGFFKIARGKNECGIEGGVVAGLVKLD